jgi:hypothetical protein
MVKVKKVLSPRGGPVVYAGAASRTEMGDYKGRLVRLLKENKISTAKKRVHVDVSWTRHPPHKEEERIVVVIDTGDEIDIIIYVDPNEDPDPGGW